ncbi:MAG: hypothetical protein M1817_003573 [Caeruleum heppii]|nr:MAG: hypothetical protein M1817_003573 [Caeruleum heppii]
MRFRFAISLSSVLTVLISSSHLVCIFSANTYFSAYNECSRSCINEQPAAQVCRTPDLAVTNSCLCTNITYMEDSARCVYSRCGESSLVQTAELSGRACALTNTPMSISTQEFIAAGKATAETEPNSDDPSNPPDTPPTDVDGPRKGLSEGEKIAIPVSIVLGMSAVVLAALQLCATLKCIDPRWRPFPHLWRNCFQARSKGFTQQLSMTQSA